MRYLHLAIDIGSESGRAYVGWIEQDQLHTEEIHRFVTQDVFIKNRHVRNLYRYYEEILQSLALYSARFGSPLRSIGVDAWGSDFVLLNRRGEVARLPSSYRDSDSNDVAPLVEERLGCWQVYQKTGNQEMPADTLHQLLRLQKDGHPSLDQPSAILFLADLFHYWLGSKPCCEHSLASYGRLFNNDSEEWDQDIFTAMRLPQSMQSQVVYAGDSIGYVHPEILRKTGISSPVEIITPCSHDTACAALSVADTGNDWAFISSGTWSLLGMETNRPICSAKAWRNNFSNSSMPLRTNMFKKIITGTWIIQRCSESWGLYSYEELVELAEAIGQNELYIDVDSKELYAAENMPLAISKQVQGLFGSEVDPLDAGRISRIWMESLAMKYRYYLEKLLDVSRKSISKVYILGGGSRNRLLNQLVANAIGYEVHTGVYEGSSVGNLLLQAFGCDEIEDKHHMRQIVYNTFPQTIYYPQDSSNWDKKYKVFLYDVPHDSEF